ncbi:hypothetical protein [Paraglaciecola hydrolytica]|uniref:Six-hairpin glycosidase n=1 Tax=Paraglaciecola hydrolytica TaxID=1799789 RepID=A0A148KKA7_9ALTE|nr:hypothetical protein [Paraglaciecola hydrolytica]KXI26754.1 hypothetical protein AX660_02985 [Paraglaciecola hydrolytica]
MAQQAILKRLIANKITLAIYCLLMVACTKEQQVVITPSSSSAEKTLANIQYDGEIVVNSNADGGLRPVIGVQNIQVYRANRINSMHADKVSDTYTHAPMLAYWRGKFYLNYLHAPVNEHDPNTSTSLTSSTDGITWEAPKVIFPAYQLSDGNFSINHQRASFYHAPNGKLLTTAFFGSYPKPHMGEGVGRAVREIYADGSLSPIYFIRLNANGNWTKQDTEHFPLFSTSDDKEFIAACESLLADRLITSPWWEEDRLDKTGLYGVEGQALSYYTLPSGQTMGIVKAGATFVTDNKALSWQSSGQAINIPASAAKYWGQKTTDGRYALAFNPTTRLRHPLAIATSENGQNFQNLLAVHGELPVQRYPGKYKNMGAQYVRGIVEGNGTPADGNLWLTYSVNKEDIWVSMVPTPTQSVVSGNINDDFSQLDAVNLPIGWNIYKPLWAPVTVYDTRSAQGNVLSLADEDPYDYASVTRVFPASRSALIRFKLLAKQVNGRLEIDLVNAAGLRAVQLAFTEQGQVEAKHEGIWKPAGTYTADKWMDVEIDVNPDHDVDSFQFRINGEEVLYRKAYFTELVPNVERLVIRTGEYRRRGSGGHELTDADIKSTKSQFLIDDVSIVANREPES